MAIAGHVSRDMLEGYSHIRVEAKRAALGALSGRKPEGSGTVNGTMGQSVPVYSDLSSNERFRRWAEKIGGRYRALVATSFQVQNRMVEILRMCAFNLSNRNTATRPTSQIIAEQAFSENALSGHGPQLSMILEVFTKNWK